MVEATGPNDDAGDVLADYTLRTAIAAGRLDKENDDG
jgi:hypothetical protein